MTSKVRNAYTAVGYWGRDPSKRTDLEQSPERIRALLQDKLLTRGKNVYLWRQVTEDNYNSSLECSCTKNTTDRPDTTCSSCYGVQLVPGYVKFSHETLYMASITSGAILVNTIVDKDIKPYRVLLDTNQLSGSITSPRIQYSNESNFDWDYRCDYANIKNSNLVTCSFSTDGITFYPIEEINDVDKKPIGVGYLYLKSSLARSTVNDRSPEFEIMRVRHPTKTNPYIKILRPQFMENPTWFTYGRRSENLGEAFWTVPLDFFDSTIPANTPSAKILENSFYERVTGIHTGIRYVTLKLKYNEEFGIFTQQAFESRRTQPEEVYSRLVF